MTARHADFQAFLVETLLQPNPSKSTALGSVAERLEFSRRRRSRHSRFSLTDDGSRPRPDHSRSSTMRSASAESRLAAFGLPHRPRSRPQLGGLLLTNLTGYDVFRLELEAVGPIVPPTSVCSPSSCDLLGNAGRIRRKWPESHLAGATTPQICPTKVICNVANTGVCPS